MIDRGSYEIGYEAKSRPYVPSFAALQVGVEVHGSPQEAHSPGVAVSNGQLLGSCTGGFIVCNGEIWGSDFVAARGDQTKSYLLPAEKSDIRVERPQDNVGFIEQPGLVVLTTMGGLAILSGIITDKASEAEIARNGNERVSQLENGLYVIQGFPKRGEIVDFEGGGITVIKWRD